MILEYREGWAECPGALEKVIVFLPSTAFFHACIVAVYTKALASSTTATGVNGRHGQARDRNQVLIIINRGRGDN